MDNRKISLCITTYNRYELTLEAFAQVANDERISEIVIVDDCSESEIYKKLETAVSFCKKVKLFYNLVNEDCYRNKRTAVSFSSNEWCVIWDSDNIMTTDYLDKIFAIDNWDENTFYQPAFARPLFDFSAYAGMTINRHNVAEIFDRPMASTMFNAMNYFVNRDRYLEVWQSDIDPHTADSILQNYNHLANGGEIYVVPHLEYDHRVHNGSHYKLNNHKTGNLYEIIEIKMKQLK